MGQGPTCFPPIWLVILTHAGVSVYAAVMVDMLSSGVVDVSGTDIIPKCPVVAAHCPAQIDYPRLLPKLVTCKAMSTGRFALRDLAMSAAGHTRRAAQLRLGPQPASC